MNMERYVAGAIAGLRRLALLIIALVSLVLLSIQGQIVVHAQTPIQSVLTTGGTLQGSNGMAFDDNDQLYVVNAFSRELSLIDRATGSIIRQLGITQTVGAPDDVAIGPDGAIYWTEPFLNQVRKYSLDGQSSVIAQLTSPGINPIAFADDGRLFVALCIGGEAIYELDPAGVRAPRVVAENVGAGSGCALNGMDFGPDGLLYGPRMFLGDIVKVDVDTGAVTIVADGFTFPVAVKFNSRGQLFVNETPGLFSGMGATGTVWQVDPTTGTKESLVTLPFGLDNMAIDSTDRVFVSSQTNGAITEILTAKTTRTVTPGGMILPGGVARHQGALYVADFFNLHRLDLTTGEIQKSLGAPIGVTTIAADGDNLLLTSTMFQSVQVRNPVTNELLENYTDFAAPLNAVRFQDKIVVADLATGSLIQIDGEKRTPLATGLGVPTGLAVTNDDLWVSEFATGKILQVVADGNVLNPPVQTATELMFPEGLAVGIDNNLIVVESGVGRLSSVDIATGLRTTLAANLALGIPALAQTIPTWIFNGVTVDERGVIYVTADSANQIYRFDPTYRIVLPLLSKD